MIADRVAREHVSKLRVVYRPVTDDLADGSKQLGEKQSVELVDWDDETHDGDIVRVRGTTDDGREVIAPLPEAHQATVRTRDDSDSPFGSLGWVQHIEGVRR